jgi:Fic family protein
MMTLKKYMVGLKQIPAITAWYLADIEAMRGKQELYTRQSPQRLKVLREHALIESAISSNRIEGIEVDQSRIRTIIFGRSLLHDRNEEEVRGYRNALKLIHEQGTGLLVSEETIRGLHGLCRGEIWDAGKYKEKDGDIIERYADGRERIRFRTVPAIQTSSYMIELVRMWEDCLKEKWVHPAIAMAAFNLDFLCIHPFRDGNGRVSRLLFLLQCYHLGYEAGRYISIERLIEQNKDRYYETLEMSSQGWHEGKHDPWHFINYLFSVLKTAYKEFIERVGQVKSPRGTKTELVETAIKSFHGSFGLSDLERACPGVSRDMVRTVLRNMQKKGLVECMGKGPGAQWKKKGNTLKRG